MLKHFSAVAALVRQIGASVDDLASDLAGLPTRDTGYEEAYTAQLQSEIELHLLDRIRNRIDGTEIGGLRFSVHLFSRRDEKQVGADLLGILEIEWGGRRLTKGYLAQAKIARETAPPRGGQRFLEARDPRIRSQADDMLRLSSDSFFFLYSRAGVHVVPAFHVSITGENAIHTREAYYQSLGDFYESFFTCFVGDHLIAPDKVRPEDLRRLAEERRAGKVLLISAVEVETLRTKERNRR